MPAPRDIVDTLESVVSIYFSDVRHKLRAAFILQDELVEMTGKTKIRTGRPRIGYINFHDVLRHSLVGLDAGVVPLGATLQRNHATRNELQHGNAAFTVDDQHCADAILDAVEAIEHCFPGSQASFHLALRIALRVVRLHSSQGNLRQRGDFEDAMRNHRWNGSNRRATVGDPPFTVGTRRYWGLVIMPACAEIEDILNRLAVP